jgi:hypothetical protein
VRPFSTPVFEPFNHAVAKKRVALGSRRLIEYPDQPASRLEAHPSRVHRLSNTAESAEPSFKIEKTSREDRCAAA